MIKRADNVLELMFGMLLKDLAVLQIILLAFHVKVLKNGMQFLRYAVV